MNSTNFEKPPDSQLRINIHQSTTLKGGQQRKWREMKTNEAVKIWEDGTLRRFSVGLFQ